MAMKHFFASDYFELESMKNVYCCKITAYLIWTDYN